MSNSNCSKVQEQKKSNGNYTQFSTKIFRGNPCMKEFIAEVKQDKFSFKCLKCKDVKGKIGKILKVNSLKTHLLSVDHRINTPEEEMKKYEELQRLFEEEPEFEKKKNFEEQKEEKNYKDYLQFIAFLLSQRLSFCQIEAIGKFLQRSYKEKKLKFLQESTFDQKFLSEVTQNCFKVALEEDIKQKLSVRPYSLIIDNSTFCGSNLCALKVRYLEKEWNEDLKMDITTIQNKVIALSDLGESSSGQSLKEIIEKKYFQILKSKRI